MIHSSTAHKNAEENPSSNNNINKNNKNNNSNNNNISTNNNNANVANTSNFINNNTNIDHTSNFMNSNNNNINTDDNISFNCIDCPNAFNTENDLTNHSAEVHSNAEVTSNPRKNNFNNNKNTNKNNSFICIDCPQAFTFQNDLLNHSSEAHKTHSNNPSKRFTCVFCPQSFTSQNDLMKHSSQTHFNKEIDSFNIVPETVSQRSQSKQFSCVFCPEKFQLKKQLLEHSSNKHFQTNSFQKSPERVTIRLGSGKAQFGCSKCSITYGSKERLLKHISKEHNQSINETGTFSNKLIPFSQIKDSFKSVDEGKEASRTSSIESKTSSTFLNNKKMSPSKLQNNFVCKFCSEAFDRLELLMFHVRGVHPRSMTNSLQETTSIGIVNRFSSRKHLETTNDPIVKLESHQVQNNGEEMIFLDVFSTSNDDDGKRNRMTLQNFEILRLEEVEEQEVNSEVVLLTNDVLRTDGQMTEQRPDTNPDSIPATVTEPETETDFSDEDIQEILNAAVIQNNPGFTIKTEIV
jgi:uncharacterized C2H2 Zn-finger protein